MRDPAFRREQRGVGIRMALALTMSVAVIGSALWAGPDSAFDIRMKTVVLTASLTIAWLAAAIGNVARLRFFLPEDIAGSSRSDGSDPVRIGGAILQNTLEQVMLSVPVQIAAAITIDQSVALLAGLAASFAIGRLLFWRGYANGASARALGFALTFYPSVMALGVVIVAAALRL